MRYTRAGCVCLVALSACTSHSQHDRVGISTDGDGILIVYWRCPGEEAVAARLYEMSGSETVPDGSHLIWEQAWRDSSGLLMPRFTPSDDAGPIQLDPEKEYWVDVQTVDGLARSLAFERSDLSGLVRSNGHTIDGREWVESAEESC